MSPFTCVREISGPIPRTQRRCRYREHDELCWREVKGPEQAPVSLCAEHLDLVRPVKRSRHQAEQWATLAMLYGWRAEIRTSE